MIMYLWASWLGPGLWTDCFFPSEHSLSNLGNPKAGSFLWNSLRTHVFPHPLYKMMLIVETGFSNYCRHQLVIIYENSLSIPQICLLSLNLPGWTSLRHGHSLRDFLLNSRTVFTALHTKAFGELVFLESNSSLPVSIKHICTYFLSSVSFSFLHVGDLLWAAKTSDYFCLLISFASLKQFFWKNSQAGSHCINGAAV